MTDNLGFESDIVEEEDPRTQLWESIAEGLASLSEASDTPKGVSAASSMFTSSEVDLTSDSWMARLADVQGWLNFGNDLPFGSRADFLAALISELEFDPSHALTTSGPAPQLSVAAVERLSERIEVACRLQQSFQDELEKGATRGSASETWLNAWGEEEPSNEPVSTEPVTAKADVWHIWQLTKKKLNLTPTYQRGDVWRTGDRQALVESILRGIPLPSIILLRKGGSAPHEVVDGKQRLTAILRFVGAHPIALEKVKEADARHPGKGLLTDFTEDYPKFRAAWKTLEKEILTADRENAYYFPFKLRNSELGGLVGSYLEPLQGKYYTQIKDKMIRVADQEVKIQELFEGAPDYKVPVIEYTSASQRQIHEVFKLYNKQGVHLNAEEIRNAVYHDIDLTKAILFASGDADPRANVSDFAKALEAVDDLHQLGKTLTGYGFGASRYRRTKVLAWVIAVLLNDTGNENLKSTASHIDDLLNRVQKSAHHQLRDSNTLADLFRWMVRSAEIHAGYEELWSDSFKDGDVGAKWQELQLVGSLVGIALAVAASPDDIDDRIAANADQIRSATDSREWQRPEKTQTRTQWDYIARVAKGVVELIGLDPTEASVAVRDRYGSSGFESLQRMTIATQN